MKSIIISLTKNLSEDYTPLYDGVWVHKTAKISQSALILPPCIIGADTEVRHCAYLRGCVLIGEGCVIGNSTEVKNSVLFDGVQVPHFNYVGDSILGYKSHFGAGVIASNVKGDKSPVTVKDGEFSVSSGLKKFGAVVGDFAEIGCNCVLNPGTVVGAYARIYPLSNVRGTVPFNCIYKSSASVVSKK